MRHFHIESRRDGEIITYLEFTDAERLGLLRTLCELNTKFHPTFDFYYTGIKPFNDKLFDMLAKASMEDLKIVHEQAGDDLGKILDEIRDTDHYNWYNTKREWFSFGSSWKKGSVQSPFDFVKGCIEQLTGWDDKFKRAKTITNNHQTGLEFIFKSLGMPNYFTTKCPYEGEWDKSMKDRGQVQFTDDVLGNVGIINPHRKQEFD